MSDDALKTMIMEGLREPVGNPTPVEPTPTPVEPTPIPPVEPVPPAPLEPTPNDPPADPIEPPAPVVISEETKLVALNEALGTSFTSLEEAAIIRNSLSEIPTLQEAKKKYEELQDVSIAKFHSKGIEELNTFAMQTGIEDASFIRSIKKFDSAEAKDPIEALVIAEILKDPSLIDQKDLLKKSIQREYKLNVDPDLEGEELEVAQENAEMEKFRLNRKAAEATKEINAIMDKVKNTGPVLTVSESIKQRNELKAQWANIVEPNVDKLFLKVPIQVPKGKDANGKETFETIDYIELTSEQAKAQADKILKSVERSGLELTQENLITLVTERYKKVLAENFTTVLAKQAARTESALRLKLEKEATNPSQIKVETPANAPAKISTEDKILAAFYASQR